VFPITSTYTSQPSNIFAKLLSGFVFRLAAAGSRDGIYAHYDLGNEIGKGSFASVYKAMHRQSGQWYAVKMIQADKIRKNPATQTSLVGDARKATAFAREISILEQLSHPNICRLKETFFHDNNISTFEPLRCFF
jgi:serine/threonine/tyrosine protein kinase RAD53